MKKSGELPIEVFFLKYAFPCAFITLQRGRLTQVEFDELENAAINNLIIERSRLEKIFVPAFRRMKKLAKKTGLDVWSKDLMKEYYHNRHNEIIEAKEESYKYAPLVLRELCKVMPALVVSEKDGSYVVQLENNKRRPVMSLCGKLNKGDRVMVHYGYAVSFLDQ
jgi:hypothetical protein